jgi:membrane-associated phospholipid phosphatase
VKRSHWWREVLLIAAFYGLYSLVRDLRGDKPVSIAQALTNAHRVIRFERWFGIFHEQTVQHWFLHDTGLLKFCDDFYGTAHFIAAIGILILLFFRFPEHYRLWRNTLAFTTGLALIGFYFFPLMPPRLLPAGYQFVDTLRVVGGLWNFSSGPVNDVSNQYAAMPSLHTAWSTWCALVVISLVRPWWAKALALLYPLFTIFCIVVTANHYFLDAIIGVLLVVVSYFLALVVTRSMDQIAARKEARAVASKTLEPDGADEQDAVNPRART